MENRPPITLSSLDLERIEDLMRSEKYRNLPQIAALKEELERATILDPHEMPANVISMNSTARFADEATKEEFELTLVYPAAAGADDKVSVFAPVGIALLGLSEGQSIAWQVPGGRRQLRVLKIVSQPEAQGQYHR